MPLWTRRKADGTLELLHYTTCTARPHLISTDAARSLRGLSWILTADTPVATYLGHDYFPKPPPRTFTVGDLMALLEKGIADLDITEQTAVKVFWSDGAEYVPAHAEIYRRGDKVFVAIDDSGDEL